MAFILTILTIVATLGYWVFTVLRTIEAVNSRDRIGDRNTGELLALAMIPIALAVCFFLQTGPTQIAAAYTWGDVWASPYVLHIPTAGNFWIDFLPAHISGRAAAYASFPYGAPLADVFGMIALAIGIALFFQLRFEKRAQAYFQKKPIFHLAIWCLVHVALYLVAFEIAFFLLAHLIGTLMFFTTYWWIPLALIVLVGMGAGGREKVYNKNGKEIGEIDRGSW